jgi:hypothetical protein
MRLRASSTEGRGLKKGSRRGLQLRATSCEAGEGACLRSIPLGGSKYLLSPVLSENVSWKKQEQAQDNNSNYLRGFVPIFRFACMMKLESTYAAIPWFAVSAQEINCRRFFQVRSEKGSQSRVPQLSIDVDFYQSLCLLQPRGSETKGASPVRIVDSSCLLLLPLLPRVDTHQEVHPISLPVLMQGLLGLFTFLRLFPLAPSTLMFQR